MKTSNVCFLLISFALAVMCLGENQPTMIDLFGDNYFFIRRTIAIIVVVWSYTVVLFDLLIAVSRKHKIGGKT